jgi:hypothetical protein
MCTFLTKRETSEEKEVKIMEGYSTFSPAELSNEMLDDFKVILYEYSCTQEKSCYKATINLSYMFKTNHTSVFLLLF